MTYGTPDAPGSNPHGQGQPGPNPPWQNQPPPGPQRQNAPGPYQQQPGGPWRPPPRRPHRWRNRLLIAGGIVVVLFIALIVVGLTTSSNPQPTAAKCAGLVHLNFGQKAKLCSGWTSDGIVSATVYSLQMPFTSQTSNTPDAGQLYALGSVQVCAGPQGANTTNELLPFPFALVYPGNQTYGALEVGDAAKEPDLGNTPSTLSANQCVRAYVTFQYAKNTTPLSVAWGSPNQPAYEWTAAG
jgi:hypothetical protein